jgi:type II secretory pathway pseudopilin PulG
MINNSQIKKFTNKFIYRGEKSQSLTGFTVVELLVVLSIMVLMVGALILDFYRHRNVRDLKIAQNELITNLRKVQSSALFSTDVGSNNAAQYQIIKFSNATPNEYQMQGIADATIAPQLFNLETIKLPKGVNIVAKNLTGPIWPLPVPSDCTLLAFKSPYGKIYLNNGCTTTSPAFSVGDSYKKILDHVSNNPSQTVSTDADLVIQLSKVNSALTNYVIIKGVTGLICPSTDGVVCGY